MGKGMIHIQDSRERDDTRFHHTTQMVHNLRFRNYLLLEMLKEKHWISGDYCIHNLDPVIRLGFLEIKPVT